MTSMSDPPVRCPVIIGRERDLRALQGLIARLRAGGGMVALLSGEAGIGKSRLAAEARGYADAADCAILQGSCFEHDRSLPYAPLIDLLHAFCAAHPPEAVARALGPGAPELLRLVPAIARNLPGCGAAATGPEPEQGRLFRALLDFFIRLSADRPLLLTIEDLHWCDDATLEFLIFLAPRVARLPILLLCTYRDEDVHPSLRHFLAECDRQRLAMELPLGRLSAMEVEAMLRAISGMRPAADFLHALFGLTDGNPFFVEEVLRSLSATDDPPPADGPHRRGALGALRIPRSVQDAVQRRVARLSAPARETLTLAAIAGRRFDFALLRALTGDSERDLLHRMKELVAAQLVVEESADRFAFRHALTRAAIADELLGRERMALHGRIGAVLERMETEEPDARVEDLAYHFAEAGDWERTLRYATRAAAKAESLHAPGAAIEHLTRALAAAGRLPDAATLPLYRARARANAQVGAFEAAQEDYTRALAEARRAGDHAVECSVLLDLGLLWAGRDYAQAEACYQQAMTAARAAGDPALLGHSLNRIGNWHLNMGAPHEAVRLHREALSIFERLDDAAGTAETLDLLGMANYHRTHLPESMAWYERAVAQFRALDNRVGLAAALAMLTARGGNYDMEVPAATDDDRAAALAAGEEARATARAIEWRAGEAFALYALGMALGPRGAFAPAFAAADECLRIAGEIDHIQWAIAAHRLLGQLHLDLLAADAAVQHLDAALGLARGMNATFWVESVGGSLASAHIARGDLDAAADVLGAVGGIDAPVRSLGQRWVALARIELALARRDPETALHLLARIEAPTPRTEHLRGAALAASGRAREAETTLIAARDAAHALGMRPLLWRTERALGDLLRAQGRRRDAERAFSAARTIVAELAAEIPDAERRRDFEARAMALLPRPRPPTPLRGAKQAFAGLTARERDIAGLIAAGGSNREIADALNIGERTVETHVGNILAKLGVASRAQIAAWAAERGLARREPP